MFISKYHDLYLQLHAEGTAVCDLLVGNEDDELRARAFYAFATDCLSVFEQYPAAQGIRLVCDLHVGLEKSAETEVPLTWLHSVRVKTIGFEHHSLPFEVGGEPMRRCYTVPFRLIGVGSCTVERQSHYVRRYLMLRPARAAEYRTLVRGLASAVADHIGRAYWEFSDSVEQVYAAA